MVTKPTPAFRVHVHDGQVWFAAPDQMPIPAARRVLDFVSNLPARKGDVVQVMASPQNINMILCLYEHKLRGSISSLQICSPAGCPTNELDNRPEIAIMNMAQWQGWPASLGGWHEFTEDDYPSYYLARHFSVGGPYELVENVLQIHPAWKALSFIPHLNEEACARLTGLILDPRWYVDPEEPEKNTRLEGYLGLDPKTQKQALETTNSSKAKIQRCLMVQRCWRWGRPTSKSEYAQPNNFLWRIHATEATGHKADLRASQTFVSFLKNVWLDAMYKHRGSAGCDGLFVPDYFFKNQDESVAFKEHMKR